MPEELGEVAVGLMKTIKNAAGRLYLFDFGKVSFIATFPCGLAVEWHPQH